MYAVEHVAWQVKDPVAVAKWYCDNLGFRVLRKLDKTPMTHFIEDASGKVVVEIYNNPAATVPDYPAMHHLHLHLAFVSENPDADRDRMVRLGCKVTEDIVTPAGDKLVMVKDPFGFAIQFCKRAVPMLSEKS